MIQPLLRACPRLFALGIMAVFAATPSLAANPFVHQLFSSNLVLQRDASDPIWGWVSPGGTVTVTVQNQNSNTIQTTNTVAGTDGRWQVTVGPFGLVTNNAAYTIIISSPGQTTVTLTNVLIGDVWLFSGQSNMAFSMNSIGVINTAQEVADSVNYTNLRCFTVPEVETTGPQTNLGSGSWQVVGPSNAGNLTASGYFTAREIYKQQHIPIGILCSAWPGTEIECWVNLNFALSISDYIQPYFDQTLQTGAGNSVSYIYNAMIAPLPPFRIRAVEWYQGEYNTSIPQQYSRMLPGLMSSWRSWFGQTNLPFIIIQLPNYSAAQTQPVEVNSWAELRDAQLNTVLNDTNSRLVSTIDIGQGALHPTDKQDVGLRAAWAAANLVYGQNIVDECPLCTAVSVSGTNLRCTFANVGAGLIVGFKDPYNPLSPVVPTNTPLLNFALAGVTGNYYAANAQITASNQVTLWSASVPAPARVRFGWGNNPPCNLYNQITDTNGNFLNGIPASPFRNDPVNQLMVNLGVGSGYYTSNTAVSVTASNFTGETFDHWSGDTNFLSGAGAATVIATQSQEYVSILANFRITAAPSGLSVASAAGQVTLNWNAMAATHYNVKRSSAIGGPYTTVGADLIGATSFTDAGVTVGSTYYYVVSATNILNEGPNSAPVTVVVSAAPPHNFTNLWDANGLSLPSPSDGSGTWLTSSNWWNGTTNVNGNWTAAPLDSAQFGAGTPGNYTISLAGGSVGATNIIFATSGYTLTNGTLSLAGTVPITVASGVGAIINCVANPAAVSVGNGGVLTWGGGGNGILGGISTGGGTFVLASPSPKTFSTGGNPTVNLGDPVGGTGGLVVSNNSTLTEGGSFNLGSGASGFMTVNSGSAAVNVATLLVARNGGASIGRLRLVNGTISAGSNTGIRVGYSLNSTAAASELDILGGTLSQNGPLLVLENSTLATATVLISGGTALLGGIDFGNGSSSGGASLTLAGGTVYLGSGGIANLSIGSFKTAITLSGGILGATTNWSTPLPMVLTNVNGYITLQAADTNGNPQNITLSGTLSGAGGLIKTGAGTLTLTGTNTYSGGITVSAGALALTTGNALMAYTNHGAALNLKVAAPGATLPASTAVFDGTNPKITFDLAALGNTTAAAFSCASLVLNANVTVNVSNAPANGTSLLLTYYGARSGAGNFIPGAIPAGAAIVDDPTTKRVLLTYLPSTSPAIGEVNYNGSQFNFSGSNGTPFSSYRILQTTNLLGKWQPVYAGQFDAAGAFTSSIPAALGQTNTFYRLVTP